MTVAAWFTLSSGIVLIFLLRLTWEFWLDRQASVATPGGNGGRRAMSTLLLVAVGGGLTLTDGMLFIAGVAALSGVRPLIFAIVAIPLVDLGVALWIYRLRGRVRRAVRRPPP